MSEPKDTKINKREYWQHQIKQWQESNLSQSTFCQQAGIKLSTFGYWRILFLKPENKKNKFVPIKIVKDINTNESIKPIQIKLLTGHIIYLPVEIGINEISKLIHSLGLPHA